MFSATIFSIFPDISQLNSTCKPINHSIFYSHISISCSNTLLKNLEQSLYLIFYF